MGEKLDYSGGRCEGRWAGSPGLVWVAWVLIVMPLVVSVFDSGEGPGWNLEAGCLAAVAFGASLFVVRRRPGNLIGWARLVWWGVVTLAWVVVPLFGRW